LNFQFRFKKKKKNLIKEKRENHLINVFENLDQKNFKKSIFFIEHIILHNNYSNLISKATVAFFYRKHFIDSLTLIIFFKFFKKKKKNISLEIGTGGGFPGLLLSIFFLKIFYVLSESIHKKSKFHAKIIKFLNLKNSKSLNSRIETIGKSKKHREFYNFIIGRAVSEFSLFIQMLFPLLNLTGKVLILKKTKQINEEINKGIISLEKNKGKIKSIFFISSINKGRIIIMLKN
jgi:16S rRNA (guanine527-N7)-methyltransferase